MPIYVFQNPKTGEIKEVSLGMNDNKEYQDPPGEKWARIFSPINLQSNSAKSRNPKDELRGQSARYITDKEVQKQGYKNANEYIDAHNEVHEEHKKKLPKSYKKIINPQEPTEK